MYTNHFYKRMDERVYHNYKKLNHKQQKIQKHHAKYLAKKALENKIAEYVDTYGYKYVYAYIGDLCYKYIYQGQKIITVYEIDINKEAEKYELKYSF